MRRLLLLTLLLLPGCVSVSTKTQTTSAPPSRPPAASQSTAVRWMRHSAEYRAICAQTYRAALAAAKVKSAGKPARTWAVSVDADETLIDNSQYAKEREAKGETYTEQTWKEWVKRVERTAVPGARTFLSGIREMGGLIAVVSNTLEPSCSDLAANLDALSLPYDVLMCKSEGAPGRKEGRWRSITSGTARPGVGPAEILIWVGDSIGDFPDQDQRLRLEPEAKLNSFGESYFALPNPVYGSWEEKPEEQ